MIAKQQPEEADTESLLQVGEIMRMKQRGHVGRETKGRAEGSRSEDFWAFISEVTLIGMGPVDCIYT